MPCKRGGKLQSGWFICIPSCQRYCWQRTASTSTKTIQQHQQQKTRWAYTSIPGVVHVTTRSPVSVEEHSLCVHVAWLFNQGIVHQTIKRYLSAIRYLQLGVPRLQYMLKGVEIVRSWQLPALGDVFTYYLGHSAEDEGSAKERKTDANKFGQPHASAPLASSAPEK